MQTKGGTIDTRERIIGGQDESGPRTRILCQQHQKRRILDSVVGHCSAIESGQGITVDSKETSSRRRRSGRRAKQVVRRTGNIWH